MSNEPVKRATPIKVVQEEMLPDESVDRQAEAAAVQIRFQRKRLILLQGRIDRCTNVVDQTF
jgi:hypothetical protein